MSSPKKQRGRTSKRLQDFGSNIFGGLFPGTKNGRSSDDGLMSPLDQAKEIQNQERDSEHSRNRGRLRGGNNGRSRLMKESPSPLLEASSKTRCRSSTRDGGHQKVPFSTAVDQSCSEEFASGVPSKFERQQRGSTGQSPTVDLCDSNSDTDNEIDEQTSSKARKAGSTPRGSEFEAKGTKRLRKHLENEQLEKTKSASTYSRSHSATDYESDEKKSLKPKQIGQIRGGPERQFGGQKRHTKHPENKRRKTKLAPTDPGNGITIDFENDHTTSLETHKPGSMLGVADQRRNDPTHPRNDMVVDYEREGETLFKTQDTGSISGGSKRSRTYKRKDYSAVAPTYPKQHLSETTDSFEHPIDDDADDSNESIVSQNNLSSVVIYVDRETGKQELDDRFDKKSRFSERKREVAWVDEQDYSESLSAKSKGHTPTNKSLLAEHSSDYTCPPLTKTPNPNNGEKDLTVPKLKENKQKKKLRYYTDVEKSTELGYEDEDKDSFTYLVEMGNVADMQGVDGSFAESKTNGIEKASNDNIPTSRKITISSPSGNDTAVSIASSSSMPQPHGLLKMRKMNNKGSRVKTKNRKAKKIIPGNSFLTLESVQWRSEKDKDEYHTSNSLSTNNETQDTGALQWDPVNGGNHQDTRRSTSRNRNQCGASTNISEDYTLPSKQRRSKRTRKQKMPETIDLRSDSEDDVAVVADEDKFLLTIELKRLAIGEKLVCNNQDHQPTVSYNCKLHTMEISYWNSKVQKNPERLHINMTDVGNEILSGPMDGSIEGLDVDLDSFIVVTCGVNVKFPKRRKQEDGEKRLVLEFQHDQDFSDLVAHCKKKCSVETIPIDSVEKFAAPLTKNSKKEYNKRKRVAPQKTDAFVSNRQSDEILVVYPFRVDKTTMEAAADGLEELSWKDISDIENQNAVESKITKTSDSIASEACNESSENNSTIMNGSQRTHFIEIRVEDYSKLDEGQWLNDSLVDMWMQWISRDIKCKRSANFHFFTSHFYTTLASEGVEGVRSWTAKKNINIFEKRLIFIPINKTLHWSLCVVVNPGAIIPSVDDGNNSNDRLLPCILFFDSLNMHRKNKVHTKVLKWLNSEWKRTNKTNGEPFCKVACKIYDPQVPRQNNGSDCGVFVCRYAFAMFQLRHLRFSYKDAGICSHRRLRSETKPPVFSDLITYGESFAFGVDDIRRIRTEFKKLIKNLHPLYQIIKEDRIKAEKEEKRARKRRKKIATQTTEINKAATDSAAAESIVNGSQDEAKNDSSDNEKNCAPLEAEEKSSKKIQRLNDDESKALEKHSTLRHTQEQDAKMDDSTELNVTETTISEDTGDASTSHLEIESVSKKGPAKAYVDREEMTKNVRTVCLPDDLGELSSSDLETESAPKQKLAKEYAEMDEITNDEHTNMVHL